MKRVARVTALALALIQPVKSWSNGRVHRVPLQLDRKRCRSVSYTSDWARRTVPCCKLERLPHRALRHVVPFQPTAENIVSSFGQTPTERHGRMVDTVALTGMVLWMGFFASRTPLGSLAWIVCAVTLVFQVIVEPILQAYRRSSEVWGGKSRRKRTRGALFSGR